jgi:hypothetical protein
MSDTEEQPTEIHDTSASMPLPTPVKKKREGVKMTDKQKKDLTKHMNKQTDLSVSEKRSLRMKLMARQRKGMSINKALKDLSLS